MKPFLCFVSVLMLGLSVPAVAADCPSGAEGHLCRAESGDPHAMFKVARAAYMDGRETGDLSEAYEWAWKSKKLGFQGGNSVLKMIYVNAPMHKNPIEAHRWITRALNDGEDYLVLWLQRLEDVMTQTQIQEANSKILD